MPQLSDLDETLLNAVRADDFAATCEAIKAGANVNARGWNNRTPLFYAASGACSAVVQLLLVNNANPNLDDDSGMTPLHVAVVEKNFMAAETLLEGGANINFQFGKGVAPIHSAFFEDLRHDETERSEFMVRMGADVHLTMRRAMGEWSVLEIAREQEFKFPHAGVILQAMLRQLEAGEKAEEPEKAPEPQEKIPSVEMVIRRAHKSAGSKYRI